VINDGERVSPLARGMPRGVGRELGNDESVALAGERSRGSQFEIWNHRDHLDRGAVVLRARVLVEFARRQGYRTDELIAIIEEIA
jgi:hypothetical protein